ncbi:MAG: hypothetical protein Q8S19_06400 [Bacillota bacterium]|nr:hypothetical protein [Bacillota bacterium]
MEVFLWPIFRASLNWSREYFRVIHHRLRVPIDLFISVVGPLEGDITEPDAQEFIYSYLKSQGKENGLIGMVRIIPSDDNILLDAAIRYPTGCGSPPPEVGERLYEERTSH